MEPFVQKSRYISDRLSYLDIEIPFENGKKQNFRIFNAYGPTQEKAKQSPNMLEKFYSELQCAIDKTPKSTKLWILGDLNAQLGKIESPEEGKVIGRYSFGERNENGENLHHLLLSNFLLQSLHASKIKTKI